MTHDPRTILVTGATGRQGGAVSRHLLDKGFALRAMTRSPDADAANRLRDWGIEIVEGDFDDAGSLQRALTGVWGVFAVHNTWEAGVQREEMQGKRFATLAREVGVQHYVYSSVGSAHRKTGIPHFDNKWRIEQTVRTLEFRSHVILRPVFFMENLVSAVFLQGDALVSTLAPDTELQMVAVDDIGKLGALAFVESERMNGLAVDIAGDAATMPRAAQVLGRALGKDLEVRRIPLEVVREQSEDMALMLEWFDRVGYDVDIRALERGHGIDLTRLEDWARSLSS
jgi:uncharacterized protein YbjT (DUF2867 family)